ncbi:hypothetical protein QJQ45_014665, partial [Haematococcus lacustris]
AFSTASGLWVEDGILDSFYRCKLTNSLILARRDTQQWNDNVKLQLQHLAAASPAGTSLGLGLGAVSHMFACLRLLLLQRDFCKRKIDVNIPWNAVDSRSILACWWEELTLRKLCHAGDATGSGFPFFDNCRRSLSETRFDLRFVRETVDPVQGSVFCWAVFVKPASTCSSPRRRCCDTTFSKVKLYTSHCKDAYVCTLAADPECNRSFDTMRVTSPLANVNFTVSVSQDNVCSARSETSCVKFTQFRAFGVSEANGTTLCIRMRPSSGGSCSTLQQITNPVLAGRSLFELGLYDVKVDNYECCPTFAYNLGGKCSAWQQQCHSSPVRAAIITQQPSGAAYVKPRHPSQRSRVWDNAGDQEAVQAATGGLAPAGNPTQLPAPQDNQLEGSTSQGSGLSPVAHPPSLTPTSATSPAAQAVLPASVSAPPPAGGAAKVTGHIVAVLYDSHIKQLKKYPGVCVLSGNGRLWQSSDTWARDSLRVDSLPPDAQAFLASHGQKHSSVGSITVSLASLEARSACGQTATMQQEEAKQYAADKATDKGRHLQAVALYRCKLAGNKLPPTTSKLLKNQLQELWAVVGNGQPTVKPVRNMHIVDCGASLSRYRVGLGHAETELVYKTRALVAA